MLKTLDLADDAGRIGPSPRLILLCCLPLAILIAVLAADQFRRQRDALLTDLANLTSEQHYAVETLVREADRQLERMRLTVTDGIARPPGAAALPAGTLKPVAVDFSGRLDEGVQWQAPDPSNGTLLGTAAVRDVTRGTAAAGLDLLSLLHLDARAGSKTHWSYFFSAASDFITIYPGVPFQDMANAGQAESPGLRSVADLVALWLSYDVFRLGTPERNPRREPYWTDVYQDAGGAGAMVSHAAPVYSGDRFRGIVGTDILLSSFDAVLFHAKQPVGLLAVANERNSVLGFAGAGGREAMQAYLGKATVQAGAASFVHGNGAWLLARPIEGSPFHLLFALPDADLRAHLLPRFAPYALILSGLAATLAALLLYLHRTYVAPSLMLARYLGDQASGKPAGPVSLPRAWRRVFATITDAFEGMRLFQSRLAESEESYRNVVNTQTELVVRYDPQGRTTFANEAYCRYIGATLADIARRTVSDFDTIVPEDRERHDAHIKALSPQAPTATIVVRTIVPPDSRVRWEEWTDTGIFDARGRLAEIQAVGRDVTERRQAEEALSASEARMAAFLEHAPVAMLTKDLDGRFTMANPEAEKRLRRQAGEIVGRRTVDILPIEEAEAMERAVARVIETGEVGIEEHHHPSLAPFLHSLFIRFPIRASGGGITGVGIFVVDQTREREAEAELDRQRDALHQSEKLAALGSLLAGVAHELNNPLSVVVGYAGMLHELASDEPTRRRTRELHNAAERCARIVRTFLAMARSKPMEKRSVDLNAVISDVLELAAYGLRSNGVTARGEVADVLPAVLADADQMHQVFMNLVVNAQQAMMEVDGSRELTVSTFTAEGFVVADVIDTGPGIPDAVRQRAFEPFFTTKPQGVGTGIGLSVCLRIVQAHGGTIALDRLAHGGTRCRVKLPMMDGVQPSEAGARRHQEAASSGRLLVVDDEPAIGAFIAEVLRGDGVEVVAARSGREALEALEEAGFDAVLTDLRMPDVSGEKLLAAIAERRPELLPHVAVMTGDALGSEIRLGEFAVPVLMKPITLNTLRAALKPLLTRTTP